jgi:hypothetical protein
MTKPLERDLQTVYTVPDGAAITGVAFGFWNQAGGKKGKRAWAVVTTKDRVYEVQGNVTTTVAGGKGGGWAEEVFKPVREGAPSKHQAYPSSCSPSGAHRPQSSKSYRETHQIRS